eukprot:scaffold740_cov405-Prasinococcus_capsulatus_cf.AAC.3
MASVDSDGTLKVWDLRKAHEMISINTGPQPANKCAYDRSGTLVAVASDDGTVKWYDARVSLYTWTHPGRPHQHLIGSACFWQ